MMAGLILVSFLMLGMSFLALSYRQVIGDKRDSLDRYVTKICQYTEEYIVESKVIYSDRNDSYWTTFSFFSEFTDSYLVLSDGAGNIMCSSDGKMNSYYVDTRIPGQIAQSVLISGQYMGTSTLGGLFLDEYYIVGRPVVVGNTVVGMIFAAADYSDILQMWQEAISIFLLVAVVILCIAFISSGITARRQTQPLKALAEATRQFGHGKYDVRVQVKDPEEEIGALAAAFNAMAESIEQSEGRRKEFIANISHELKTPMTIIAGFTDGILDGTIPPERQEESLKTIASETRRLSRLVRRMLDISRLQSSGYELSETNFDIAEVVRRVIISLEGKIDQRNLEVEAEIPDSAVFVRGDIDAITQVCYNLLDNAIKFSDEGGVIGISIVLKKDKKAYVAVRNRGREIPAEELPLIFDRFHKTDHSRSIDREGVGLGLYIVKTILNRHGEHIKVSSSSGVTEFVFGLTLAG